MRITALQLAVINQMGYDAADWMFRGDITDECYHELEDVVRHGADGGFSGFTYHKDTCEFYDANQEEIVKLVTETAHELNESAIAMIRTFRCLKGYDISEAVIGACIYGRKQDNDGEDMDIVKNALAWFALEMVALDITND